MPRVPRNQPSSVAPQVESTPSAAPAVPAIAQPAKTPLPEKVPPTGPLSSTQVAAPIAPATTVIGPESGHPWLFRLSLLVALAWWACLGWLCRTTANPALISPAQWELATVAVEGRLDAPEDTITVLRVWRGDQKLKHVDLDGVTNFSRLEPGRTYLWLLIPAGGRYSVASCQGQLSPPLVYPVTPAVTDQLERLTAGDKPRSFEDEAEAMLGEADLGAPEPSAGKPAAEEKAGSETAKPE